MPKTINDYLKIRMSFLSIYMYGLLNSKKYHPESWNEKDEVDLLNVKRRREEISKTLSYIKEDDWDRVCTKYAKKVTKMREHRYKGD